MKSKRIKRDFDSFIKDCSNEYHEYIISHILIYIECATADGRYDYAMYLMKEMNKIHNIKE